MLIFRLSGGLGNQFFSFAAGYRFCREKGEVFGLDVSTQCADWFFRDFDLANYDIRYDKEVLYRLGDNRMDHYLWNHVNRRKEIGLFTPTIRERKLYQYDPELFQFSKHHVYVIGDWQSWKYFLPVEKEIRKMYQYQNELSSDASRWKELIDHTNSVAVHIRRGDYVDLNITIDPQYYVNALAFAAEQLQDPVFYCFSEDTAWVRNAFKDLPYHFEYMEYDSSKKGLEDFELMRSCKHQIVCDSTYSWWAAYLNDNTDKLVVHPLVKKKGQDFWPLDWNEIEF